MEVPLEILESVESRTHTHLSFPCLLAATLFLSSLRLCETGGCLLSPLACRDTAGGGEERAETRGWWPALAAARLIPKGMAVTNKDSLSRSEAAASPSGDLEKDELPQRILRDVQTRSAHGRPHNLLFFYSWATMWTSLSFLSFSSSAHNKIKEKKERRKKPLEERKGKKSEGVIWRAVKKLGFLSGSSASGHILKKDETKNGQTITPSRFLTLGDASAE